MSAQGKLITIVILVAILLILLWQNSHHVAIKLLAWTVSFPVSLLIPLVGLIGFLLGLLVCSMMGRSGRKTRPRT